MYYLKYRPQQFSEIDNDKRREALQKIFQQAQVPHAFLLVGPKGTGKTSTARLIAKLLNCEKQPESLQKPKNLEPCNHCDSCLAIEKNGFLDVIELDAASTRGIDDIRALRETVNYAPAVGRYKVYIIDEVHMLTKEAFNALLKTLEEPPVNVVFILATTEPQKLPETITSRCLTITFKKATDSEIKHSLLRIVKGEKLTVAEAVLLLISRHSQGSFRDAAKLLELAVATTDLSLKSVQLLLQNQVTLQPMTLLELILKQKSDAALAYLKEYDQQGLDCLWLIERLLALLQVALLQKRGLATEQDWDSILETVKLADLSRLMKLLLEAYGLTKQSPIAALPLMIAVVDFCQPKDGKA